MNSPTSDLEFSLNEALRQIKNMTAAGCLTEQETGTLFRHYQTLLKKLKNEQLDPTDSSSLPEPVSEIHRETDLEMRSLQMLQRDLLKLHEQGELSQRSLNCCLKGIQQQLDRLNPKSDGHTKHAIPQVEGNSSPAQPALKRSLIERMLDPEALNRMMSLGAILLTVGLVIWLWTIGLFENPLIASIALGAANLGLIGTGLGLIKLTRHTSAGRGIAMLGSLLLPLNLWFYDAQGLITLDEGGHLWIPALICSMIYAAIAGLLKDSKFVYPLVGGITLTGLMILGDHRVARFYEIIAPSALLSLIGIICIHLERFFPNDESSFNRRNFGRDFYLAGHAVLIGGLGLLLGGRIVGHFFDSYFVNFGWFTKPDVVTSIKTQSLALAITLSATGTYFLAAMRNTKSRQLISAAVFTLCWSGVILFDLSGIVVTKELLLCLISTGGLIMQVTGMWLNKEDVNRQHQHFFSAIQTVYLGTLIHFGTAAVSMFWILEDVVFTPVFDVPMLSTLSLMVTTAGLAIGTLCYSRLCSTFCTRSTYWLTCVAALATLSAVCLHLGTSVGLAILVSSVALSVYQVMILNNSSLPEPLRSISGKVPSMLLLVTLAHLVGLLNVSETLIVLPAQLNVLLPLMVSLNFGLIWSQSHTYRHAIITLGALWYGIAYQLYQWELTGNAQLIAASSIGLIGIIIANLFTTSRQKVLELSDASATLLTFSGVAGLLLSANRLAGGGVTSELIGVIGMQTILCGVGSVLTSRLAFKHSLKVLTFFQVLTTVVLIASISTLTIPQRFEIGTTLFGLLMVGYGLYGWSREQQEDQSSVSLLLNLGSLLSVAPLTIGLLVERTTGFGSQSILHMMHNFGLLIILLGLIGGGLLCKIRSMTLCGFTGLACYMGSLVMLIHLPDQLKSVSVLMMIGGGLFFGTAVLLSIYRDRLLSLPDRIKQGEGIYQVLKWR